MTDFENNENPVDAESTAAKPVVPASIPKRDNTAAETAGKEFRPFFVGADSNADASTVASPFIETVYQQIDAVIGGNDPNQFLCLTIPGQALSAEDFIYDYKANAPKGPTVEANESRLANKLFDPCRMTGADNGLTLPYQYRSALDMLSPKLNEKIATAKNQLRQLLLTTYPYDLGKGLDKTSTLQEVFFQLYDDWVKIAKEWADTQNKKKVELRNKYPSDGKLDNTLYDDAYLTWYETVAESYLTGISEKMSKVLSVFTPNDMKILEGILDSGSGAELEEARETLRNTQKLTPDGGYVYPVKLNPTNWFELLNTSFTPVDLLKTPDVIATQIQTLSSHRLRLSAQINDISKLIPNDKTIIDQKVVMDSAEETLATTKSDLIRNYGNGVSSFLDAVFDIAVLYQEGGMSTGMLKKLGMNIPLTSGKNLDDLINQLTTSLAATSSAQQQYINSAGKLADAAAVYIKTKNISQLSAFLGPLKEQFEDVNAQITDLQMQFKIAIATMPTPADDGKVTEKDITLTAVTPPIVPPGYTQIVITADASALDSSTSQFASSSVSTSGVNFFFCGYESKSSTSESHYSSFFSTKGNSIQIGMNVAKVGIEREWFNPGVFVLTKDMFNLTASRISPNPTTPYTSITDDRLNDMAGKVFPCYPVAMVIVRDISIKLVSSTSIDSKFAESTESHASRGGGFLFFDGSSSSSSSSSNSGVHARSTDNTVTLKFNTPQIIGYYLQATPADKSTPIDEITNAEEMDGFVTIAKFVKDYRDMLESMQKPR